MTRPLSLAHPGAVSHGTRRGHVWQRLDANATDREVLLAALEAVVCRYHWRRCAWYVLVSVTDNQPTRGNEELESIRCIENRLSGQYAAA
jgi:hypothetical protein